MDDWGVPLFLETSICCNTFEHWSLSGIAFETIWRLKAVVIKYLMKVCSIQGACSLKLATCHFDCVRRLIFLEAELGWWCTWKKSMLVKISQDPDFYIKLLWVHGAPNEGFVCHLLKTYKTSKSRQHCRPFLMTSKEWSTQKVQRWKCNVQWCLILEILSRWWFPILFSPLFGEYFQFDKYFFSDGLKPPTSCGWTGWQMMKLISRGDRKGKVWFWLERLFVEVLGCLALATTKHRVRSSRGTAEINLGEIAYFWIHVDSTSMDSFIWVPRIACLTGNNFHQNMIVGEKNSGKVASGLQISNLSSP